MVRNFRIEPLDPETLNAYCCCLEEWSSEIREAGDLKCRWYEKMKAKGLEVLIARDEKDSPLGMIQYIPSAYAPVTGENNYHIFCTWVHAYKGKGVGDQRKQGIGKALLEEAESRIAQSGAGGITAWGIALPFWMRSAWYRKQGYRKVDCNGVAHLMWKPLKPDTPPPRWLPPSKELNEPGASGKLRVLSVINGICPAMNITHERIRKILEDYGDKIDYQKVYTDTPEGISRWGILDGLYINGKAVFLGPPPKEKKLRRILEKELKKVQSRYRKS